MLMFLPHHHGAQALPHDLFRLHALGLKAAQRRRDLLRAVTELGQCGLGQRQRAAGGGGHIPGRERNAALCRCGATELVLQLQQGCAGPAFADARRGRQAFSSCEKMASAKRSGVVDDRMASAAFAPTPVTPSSSSKFRSSSRVLKP